MNEGLQSEIKVPTCTNHQKQLFLSETIHFESLSPDPLSTFFLSPYPPSPLLSSPLTHGSGISTELDHVRDLEKGCLCSHEKNWKTVCVVLKKTGRLFVRQVFRKTGRLFVQFSERLEDCLCSYWKTDCLCSFEKGYMIFSLIFCTVILAWEIVCAA